MKIQLNDKMNSRYRIKGSDCTFFAINIYNNKLLTQYEFFYCSNYRTLQVETDVIYDTSEIEADDFIELFDVIAFDDRFDNEDCPF